MIKYFFISLFFSIPILIDVYIWGSFRSFFLNRIYFSIFFWCVSLFSILIILYPFIFGRIENPYLFTTMSYGLLFVFSITKLFIIIPLLLDDIFRLIRLIYSFAFSGDNFRPKSFERLIFLKKTAVILGAISFSTFLYGIFFGRFNFKKHYVKINIPRLSNLNKPIKIIQISDLHLGSFHSKKHMLEAVKIINSENPDLIFFTGDLVNTYSTEANSFIPILKKLKSKYGMFSVLGNHDYGEYGGFDKNTEDGLLKWNDNFIKMKKIHKEIGFKLLLNEHEKIKINNRQINIVGVENWGKGRFSKYGDIDKACEGINNNYLSILLSHDPTHWDVVKNSRHIIDLQMSGHTHGMQFGIEIPGFRWSPAKWRYKNWAGLYKNKNSYLYVNRGLGHLGYPGRVGIMPEITICELYSA